MRWTLARAARLGYLAGRGLPLAAIMVDEIVAAKSEQSVRNVCSRWNIALGIGGPFTIYLTDQERLAFAYLAQKKGCTTQYLATQLIKEAIAKA
jgi:hypothetical protein